MAALTWRNVEAPNIDTRSLAIAGQSIGGAFDRLGAVFADRDARLRKQATDDALAAGFTAGTPEEVAAMLAKGAGGLDPRADKLAVMQGLTALKGNLITQGLQNEDLLNSKARATLGDEGAEMIAAAGRGDEAAMAAWRAKITQDALGGRVATEFEGKAQDQFGTFKTRDLNEREFGETSRSNRAQEAGAAESRAIQREQVSLQRQRAEFEMTQQKKTLAEQEEAKRGLAFGQRYLDASDSQFITGENGRDALVRLQRTDQWKKMTEAERAGAERGFNDRYAQVYGTPTEQDAQELAPVRAAVQREKTEVQLVSQQVRDQAYRGNPTLALQERVASTPDYAKLTVPDLIKAYEGTGVIKPAEFIDKQLKAGRTVAELRAAIDVVNPKNDGYFTAAGNNFTPIGVGRDMLYGGQNRIEAVLQGLDEKDSLARSRDAMDKRLAPLGVAEQKLDRLQQKAQREQQQNRTVSPATLQAIAEARSELQLLNRAAMGGEVRGGAR